MNNPYMNEQDRTDLEEFTAADGTTYIAINFTRGCARCAFFNDVKGCAASPACASKYRSDGRNIAWVKKEEKK